VQFTLPDLGSASDVVKAIAAIAQAVARGDLAPSEAAGLSRLVEAYVTAIGATDGSSRGAGPGALPPIVRLVFTNDKK
jgi:hypothetical protein